MTLPEFEHFEPKTLRQACHLLKKYGDRARVIAGGTDLLNLMRHRLIEPQYLIDLKKISELQTLQYRDGEGLMIGSTVSLSELIHSPVIREKTPMLIEAARAVAAPPLQNMATVGGNVCLNTRCSFYNQSAFWRSSRPFCFKAGGSVCHVVKHGSRCHAVFQADVACALVALNAQVKLVEESGERTLRLLEFYTGKGESPNRLKPTEILTEISIPLAETRQAETYEKFSPRGALDFPQVGVAALIGYDPEGRIGAANIVLNAVSSSPVELKSTGSFLIGERLGESLIERTVQSAFEIAHPVNNTGMSPLYRKRLVRILLKRILEKFLSC